ncbi:MAG: hypothetical protein ACE5GU_09210, partial [Candidatus Scalinduaceae bacterium]
MIYRKFFFTEMYNYIKHYEKDFNTKISYGIPPGWTRTFATANLPQARPPERPARPSRSGGRKPACHLPARQPARQP